MAEIRFVNVSKVYDEDIIALERASFDIGQGEFLFFIGRNGAGKSTALKLLTGQETVTGGEVYMNGSSVSALNKKQLPYFRRQFGIMKPDLGLLRNRSILDNIIFSLRATGHYGRKMEELARAISGNPRILVLDEPTANLDPDSSWDIFCLLEELNRQGMTILAASHDREMVSVMRKRVITLSAGRVVADERRAIYNAMAADILEERRVLNERQLLRGREIN